MNKPAPINSNYPKKAIYIGRPQRYDKNRILYPGFYALKVDNEGKTIYDNMAYKHMNLTGAWREAAQYNAMTVGVFNRDAVKFI